MENLNNEIIQAIRNRCELSIGCSIYNDQYVENVVKQFEKFRTLRPEYVVFCKDPTSTVVRLRELTGLKIFVGSLDIEDKINALAGKMSFILDENEDINYPALRKYFEYLIDNDVANVYRKGSIKIINRLASSNEAKEDYKEDISEFSGIEFEEIKVYEDDDVKILFDGIEVDIKKVQQEADRLKLEAIEEGLEENECVEEVQSI